LIDSIHTASVHNKDSSDDSTLIKTFDDDQDDARLSYRKIFGQHNIDFADEYPGIIMSKHRLASRGVRLPSESILLGKRRLPVEAVLLGRRDLPNEGVLLGKRR
jgi:hypothetical protein